MREPAGSLICVAGCSENVSLEGVFATRRHFESIARAQRGDNLACKMYQASQPASGLILRLTAGHARTIGAQVGDFAPRP